MNGWTGHRVSRRVSFPWLVFAVALLLRLVPVLMAHDLGVGLDDMFQYDMLGRSIVAGDGYRWYAEDDLGLATRYVEIDTDSAEYDPRGVPTSFRPPAYPAFLAAVYFLTGVGAQRFLAARLAQALLGALLAPMTYFLARRLFPKRERVARWSAVAIAVYPLLVIYPLALATENLFFVLVVGSVLALLKARESPRLGWFAIAGALIGLSALTRSVVLPVGLAAAAWAWLGLKRWKAGVVIIGAVVLVCAPWIARNSMLHGRLTGIESSLGYNLYMGYHPESTGTFRYGISLDLMPIIDDARRDDIGTNKAIGFIRDDPARVPVLALRRLGHFFGLERRGLTSLYSADFFGYIPPPWLALLALVFVLPFAIVSASSLFGMALADWRRPEISLVGLVIACYLAPHVLILAEDRFHMALLPFLAVFAARFWDGGIAEVRTALRSPGAGRTLALLACVGVVSLLFTWGGELARDVDTLAVLFGPDGNTTMVPY